MIPPDPVTMANGIQLGFSRLSVYSETYVGLLAVVNWISRSEPTIDIETMCGMLFVHSTTPLLIKPAWKFVLLRLLEQHAVRNDE